MPRQAIPARRRAALVDATICEIGDAGTLDITVARIARRAGVSSALAHHYFGSKEQLFLAAMRHILGLYGAQVRQALATAAGPQARLRAVVAASFGPSNFHPDVVAAWLNFYVLAQTSAPIRRLLHVYHRRLRSNLVYDLRRLMPARDAAAAADGIAALIDGLYLRRALGADTADPGTLVADHLDRLLRGCR